ncbi:oxidoreductase [Anaerocolumna cellulosilytica]|uniref:Oxidoreductase n=1 Tax=Anaerocolumna cellulosilytica TaxID=433286 RepID=A0A6S6QTJ1_9FIRM|nr:Gfo/Idh/MocA family oxidoreductase [Anaerocolumna cellulosilytica]MBB5196682.1 putative dehydrogenase [Anaerocolumna cellulosilytica]BCJ93944.1 oxidoreductase [Anaerocolumna cellulosilytica]
MNTAIIGCGAIAKVHAQCVQKLANHKLSAFADTVETRAEQYAALYHGKAYQSLEEMLEKEKIDILHICTPHYLHVPMAVYALERGVNVFMEKPPVIVREQLEQLEKVQTGKQLGFCFQNRYNPSVIQVKELLESGKAGDIYGARGIVTWNRSSSYYTQSDWRGRIKTEGGGALINQSIHTLDLLTYFLGTPVLVDAVKANHHLKAAVEVEDMMEAFIRFEGGRSACFYGTTAYVEDAPPLIEIVCEKLTIRIENSYVTYYYKDESVETLDIKSREGLGKHYWGAGHFDCIKDFYYCVEKEEVFTLGLSKMKDTIRLMLSMYESADTGKEINLKEV